MVLPELQEDCRYVCVECGFMRYSDVFAVRTPLYQDLSIEADFQN